MAVAALRSVLAVAVCGLLAYGCGFGPIWAVWPFALTGFVCDVGLARLTRGGY